MSVHEVTLKHAFKSIKKSKHGHLSVLFLAQPWCGHCLAMKPVFKQLAIEFQCCTVTMYEVDMSKEGAQATQSIPKSIPGERVPDGFPTFYAFDGSTHKATTRGSSPINAFRNWMLEQGLDCSMCAPGTK
jgi:thiol-disulfide isomerase/thioredoxin